MQDDSCSWIAALALEDGQHVVGRPFTIVSFLEQSSDRPDSVLVLLLCLQDTSSEHKALQLFFSRDRGMLAEWLTE